MHNQYTKFKEKNSSLILDLSEKIGGIDEDAHWDLIEDMKSYLGSEAANGSSDDEGDQEDALSIAESWVTENCSGGGIEEDVAMALWLDGMVDGEARLHKVKLVQVEIETQKA